jgi:uncharacterized protein (TIGR02271 family)
MSPRKDRDPRQVTDDEPLGRTEEDQVIELRQEELVPRTEMQEVGEARIRTWIQETPARLEVDAYTEEVEVEHVPVGQVVSERKAPWQEDDVLIVPIYEEQLVVSKRLVMREQIRVRRVGSHRRELFEDTLRRERLDVEDPQHTGLIHERQPTHAAEGGEDVARTETETGSPGVLESLARKAFG